MTTVKHPDGSTEYQFPGEAPSPSNPAVTGARQGSLLEALQQELKEEVTVEPLRLKIEGRPNISLLYHPDFEMETIRHWQKRSAIKASKDEIDPMRFSKLVVMGSCVGIYLKGTEVRGDNGDSLRLNDREFVAMTNQVDASAGLDWLFGNDAQILVHATRVLAEAGYNADGTTLDADDENPLGAGSTR